MVNVAVNIGAKALKRAALQSGQNISCLLDTARLNLCEQHAFALC